MQIHSDHIKSILAQEELTLSQRVRELEKYQSDVNGQPQTELQDTITDIKNLIEGLQKQKSQLDDLESDIRTSGNYLRKRNIKIKCILEEYSFFTDHGVNKASLIELIQRLEKYYPHSLEQRKKCGSVAIQEKMALEDLRLNDDIQRLKLLTNDFYKTMQRLDAHIPIPFFYHFDPITYLERTLYESNTSALEKIVKLGLLAHTVGDLGKNISEQIKTLRHPGFRNTSPNTEARINSQRFDRCSIEILRPNEQVCSKVTQTFGHLPLFSRGFSKNPQAEPLLVLKMTPFLKNIMNPKQHKIPKKLLGRFIDVYLQAYKEAIARIDKEGSAAVISEINTDKTALEKLLPRLQKRPGSYWGKMVRALRTLLRSSHVSKKHVFSKISTYLTEKADVTQHQSCDLEKIRQQVTSDFHKKSKKSNFHYANQHLLSLPEIRSPSTILADVARTTTWGQKFN